ncbi:hypothetical protein HHUSO_G13580 [Huso huso]|uniref:[Protein ADP-ribosylarginine] hydrolase-like protein 1 n=1 Tax=Huso huso TaxID=61971 RepID=A0ABR0ZGV4_HUSHU
MEKYKAAMVLVEVGNAVGYQNTRQGYWKCLQKLKEFEDTHYLDKVQPPAKWKVPLNILMHMATAEVLTAGLDSWQSFYKELAKKYLIAVAGFQNSNEDLGHVPSDPEPKCVAAGRGMCIGMCYSKPEQLYDLIQASIECGRMTHSYPAGFLGSLCTALFTSYAIQEKPVSQWGRMMLGVMPQAEEYCRKKIALFSDYSENWFYFEAKWQFYLQHRTIDKDGCDNPVFPENYDAKERHKLYKRWGSESSGRRKGLEITLIIYDALLAAGNDWNQLCQRAMIHGGDSESTGAIAGCLYGLLYGIENVPKCILQNLRLKEQLERLGKRLYLVAHGESSCLCKDYISACENSTSLRQIVRKLASKRTVDEINNLLNYMALLEKDNSKPVESDSKAKEKQEAAAKPRLTRFQLLQCRFTKFGIKNKMEKLILNEPGKKKITLNKVQPSDGANNFAQNTTQQGPSERQNKSTDRLGITKETESTNNITVSEKQENHHTQLNEQTADHHSLFTKLGTTSAISQVKIAPTEPLVDTAPAMLQTSAEELQKESWTENAALVSLKCVPCNTNQIFVYKLPTIHPQVEQLNTEISTSPKIQTDSVSESQTSQTETQYKTKLAYTERQNCSKQIAIEIPNHGLDSNNPSLYADKVSPATEHREVRASVIHDKSPEHELCEKTSPKDSFEMNPPTAPSYDADMLPGTGQRSKSNTKEAISQVHKAKSEECATQSVSELAQTVRQPVEAITDELIKGCTEIPVSSQLSVTPVVGIKVALEQKHSEHEKVADQLACVAPAQEVAKPETLTEEARLPGMWHVPSTSNSRQRNKNSKTVPWKYKVHSYAEPIGVHQTSTVTARVVLRASELIMLS